MDDRFDLGLMLTDSLADWKAQLRRRFPAAPKMALDLLSSCCLPFALRFSLQLRRFHGRIAEAGLGEASRELLERYYAGVSFRAEDARAEELAGRGPVLVLANHPGVVDSLALMWALETRLGLRDYVVVANDRDFFRAMPAIRDRLIPVPDDAAGRSAVLPAIEAALAAGRSVVLYPSGEITNDPALAPEIYPYDSLLGAWSPSVGLLIARARRRAPGLAVLPLVCGGVLPPRSADARWMGSKRSRREREALAVAAILAFGAGRRATVAVRAGRPIRAATDLAGLAPKELGAAVYARAAATAGALARELRSAEGFQDPPEKAAATADSYAGKVLDREMAASAASAPTIDGPR